MIKVLIVEDTYINALLMKYCISLDCLVKTVDNGQKMLDILEIETFDIIICDIEMTVLDGVSARKLMKPNNSFYYCTSHDYSEEELNDKVIRKPANIDDIKTIIEEFNDRN